MPELSIQEHVEVLRHQLEPLFFELFSQLHLIYQQLPPFPYKRQVCLGALTLTSVFLVAFTIHLTFTLWNRIFRKRYANRGEKLFATERFEEALNYFLKTGNLTRVAQCHVRLGSYMEAADTYFQLKKMDMAAKYYLQAGNAKKAAAILFKTGRQLEAAETFERAGEFVEAARIYQQLKHLRKAADMYAQIEYFGAIGDMYAKELRNTQKALEQVNAKEPDPRQSPSALSQGRLQASIQEFSKLSGDAYSKVPDHAKAAIVYLEGGHTAAAADAHQLNKNHTQAAELFLEANLQERAAQSYELAEDYVNALRLYTSLNNHDKVAAVMEKMGNQAEAAEYRAKIELQRGQRLTAANQYREAGKYSEAAQLYLEENDFANAAESYVLANQYSDAAEHFERAEMFDKAALYYEKAQRYTSSANCYLRLNNEEKYIATLEKGGAYLEAGLHLMKQDPDGAIRLLQNIDEDSPDYRYACNLLGNLFLRKEMISLAKEKFERSIHHEEINRRSLDYFYDYAAFHMAHDDKKRAHEIFEGILSVDYHYKDVLQRSEELKADAKVTENTSALGSGGRVDLPSTQVDTTEGTQVINERYIINKEVGRGGMGIVYKALDKALDRPVALKFLPSDLGGDSVELEKFLNEARSAARLNHSNIVTVYDIEKDTSNGSYFIVMEFVEGANLKEIIEASHNLPFGVIRLIAQQICDGLAYAHNKSIVHRDVKTANILWTDEKVVKITDFGLAKVINDARKSSTVALGSPVYMSPEQVLGKPVDGRSDIYSLGITIYEMVTGKVPFDRGDIGYHHVNTPLPDPREYRDDIPDDLHSIISRCTLKNPDERFNTTSEITDVFRPQ